MKNELITTDWLRSKGFKNKQIGSYQYWRRVNEDGLYLDWLVFRKNDIASFGLIGLDMITHFKSIMQNEKKIFYTYEIIEIYKHLTDDNIE